MINAYDRSYLGRARISFGRMLDYAVYDLGYDLTMFWTMFLASPICHRFESGDPSVIAGRSGVELALMVAGIDKDYPKPIFSDEKSEEYWLGWALAYYQWSTGASFSQLTKSVSITEMLRMYYPYHEMDIRQFCDRVSEMRIERQQQTSLKRRRLEAGLSQSELSSLSGVPLRTIQQYEQGQKDISKARVDYIIAFSKVLCCDCQSLIDIRRTSV